MIDVVLPKSEVTASCISLVRGLQEKENLVPKLGSRMERKTTTTSRVAQMLARR